MKKLWEQYREVIFYLFFGVCTTVVNFAVYVLCRKGISLNYPVSLVISWFISVLFAFVTNKYFVFARTKQTSAQFWQECWRFYFYRILSLAGEMVVFFIGFSLLKLPEMGVKLGGQVLVIILNYLFSKFLIFVNRE